MYDVVENIERMLNRTLICVCAHIMFTKIMLNTSLTFKWAVFVAPSQDDSIFRLPAESLKPELGGFIVFLWRMKLVVDYESPGNRELLLCHKQVRRIKKFVDDASKPRNYKDS